MADTQISPNSLQAYERIATLIEDKEYWEEKKREFIKFFDTILSSNRNVKLELYTETKRRVPDFREVMFGIFQDREQTVKDTHIDFEINDVEAALFLAAILKVIDEKINTITEELHGR